MHNKIDSLPSPYHLFKMTHQSSQVDEFKNLLAHGKGYIIFKNFPLDNHSESDYLHNLENFLKLFILTPNFSDPKMITISRVTPVPNASWANAYSQTNHEVPFHTDDAGQKIPRKYMALLVVNPANDGGESKLLSTSEIKNKLLQMNDGQKVLEILTRSDFPFAIPQGLIDSKQEKSSARILNAPILGTNPFIRYRFDEIKIGFAMHPELATEENIWAIDVFNKFLQKIFNESQGIKLERGDLLLANNYLILHGRTAFSDNSRLLYRARMHDVAP